MLLVYPSRTGSMRLVDAMDTKGWTWGGERFRLCTAFAQAELGSVEKVSH